MLDSITPIILTYNEAPNIGRTLSRLSWAKQVLVIDSFSTDSTLEILQRYPNVRVLQRPFDSLAQQWNYGLTFVNTEWALSLDADYLVTPELQKELSQITPTTNVNSYWVPFKYCVFGSPLKGTILPPRRALFRPQFVHYIDDGHRQLLQPEGESKTLKMPLLHDDQKTLQRWLWAQDCYAELEVKKLRNTSIKDLGWSDRIRLYTPLAPLLVIVYCLLLKRGLWDGPRGWYYALQRCVAEIILALRLLESRAADRNGKTVPLEPVTIPVSSVHS